MKQCIQISITALILAALPAPLPAATAEVRLTLRADAARVLEDGPFRKSQLERGRYFRSYQSLGAFSDQRHAELAEIGAEPGRGTFRFHLEPDPDPARAFTPESVEATIAQRETHYRRATERAPDLEHALAHGPYLEWMRPDGGEGGSREGLEDWELQARGNILRSDLFEPVADVIARWYTRKKEWGFHYPIYYTVQNEPVGNWNVDTFSRYSRIVAGRMQAAHPDVMVAGPCSAWPYPMADWSRWRNWESRFIEQAGGAMQAYDLHFYSKGYWALPRDAYWQARRMESPFLYANQKQGNTTVWDFGRLDAYLDLWNAHHQKTWGGATKPMIVSEFGRQTIYPQFGPWINDFWPWLYMTTVTRMWMTLMDRPEVRLTIPFILGEADRGYAPMRGQAIYSRLDPDNPADLSVTRFRDFYAFFSDLQGLRLPWRADCAPAVSDRFSALPLRDGNRLYVLLHNAAGSLDDHMRVVLDTLAGEQSRAPARVAVKRIRYEGAIPQPEDNAEAAAGLLRIAGSGDYEPLAGPEVVLMGEEIAILRMEFAEGVLPAAVSSQREIRHYGEDTLVDFAVGRIAETHVVLPDPLPENLRAVRLRLGLARDGGFTQNPRVAFNEARLPAIDLEHTVGIAEYFAPADVDIPLDALQPGRNRVRVAFPRPVLGGAPYLVSARVDLIVEEGDK
jgi:hypothetical protein